MDYNGEASYLDQPSCLDVSATGHEDRGPALGGGGGGADTTSPPHPVEVVNDGVGEVKQEYVSYLKARNIYYIHVYRTLYIHNSQGFI